MDGEVEYDVKAGTQTDARVRLRGKGMPSLRNKGVRGDHYVTLVVEVPTNLSHAAKEALKEYDKENGNTLNQKPEAGKPKKKAEGKSGRLIIFDKNHQKKLTEKWTSLCSCDKINYV